MSNFPIQADKAKVRYVKLGYKGEWESDCLKQGILRFGFDTALPASQERCRMGQWNELAKDWRLHRKNQARATMDASEVRKYWTDDGTTLWITFIRNDLCWGFLEPGEPLPYDGDNSSDSSSFRRVRGGWSSKDAEGNALTKSNLPGFITKVASYRGTTCSVDRADRLVDRINAKRTPDVDRVKTSFKALQDDLATLIRNLDPREFETLVDMIFSRSGWRRVGAVGGTTKDRDLDLEMPLTGERAYVQVKTGTSTSDLEEYSKDLPKMRGYDRMFFVYHTASHNLAALEGSRVTVLNATGVAALAIEAGLVDWIISRVY